MDHTCGIALVTRNLWVVDRSIPFVTWASWFVPLGLSCVTWASWLVTCGTPCVTWPLALLIGEVGSLCEPRVWFFGNIRFSSTTFTIDPVCSCRFGTDAESKAPRGMPGRRDYAVGKHWVTKIRIAPVGTSGRSKYRTLKRRRSDEAPKEPAAGRLRRRHAKKVPLADASNAAQALDCLS